MSASAKPKLKSKPSLDKLTAKNNKIKTRIKAVNDPSLSTA
jgi:hypothetical protein